MRLDGYDYSQNGYYHVTICSQNRECFFGDVEDFVVILNDAGKMIFQIWKDIPKYNSGIFMDEFIIMPNHIHGIIRFDVGNDHRVVPHMNSNENNNQGQAQWPIPTSKSKSLSDIIKQFKTLTTNKYIEGVHDYSWKPFHKKIWQKGFYDQILWNENDLNFIRNYIKNNPPEWENDEYNPKNIKTNK